MPVLMRLFALHASNRCNGPPGLAAGAQPVQLIASKSTLPTTVVRLCFQNPLHQLLQQLEVFPCTTIGAQQVQLDESRSEEHTSELQSRGHLVCRLLLEIKIYRRNCPITNRIHGI